MIETCSVLICGAGPTGLMMACQLQRWAIDYVIIDAKPGTTTQSRAVVVHARSLELFGQMGIGDEAIARGVPAKALNLIVSGRLGGRISFEDIGQDMSPFPFVLMLEQSKTESLLYDFIKENTDVRWQQELVSFEQRNGGVIATIKSSGGEYQVQTSYLVGADGAHSAVRHVQGISFAGGTYEHLFFVADTGIDWPFSHDELYIVNSPETFSAFFPMPGEDRYRVIGILPGGVQDEKKVQFEDIKNTVQEQLGLPLTFKDTRWFSPYRVHHRVVATFSKGPVFLLGDAAHIHSPAGGQGMNTGLQDAWNLGWKLALLLQGKAATSLLATYDEERRAVAIRLVRTTDQLFAGITSESRAGKWFKLKLLPVAAPLLMRIRAIRRFAFQTVSQIAIRYRRSSLSKGGAGAVKAGDRFPFMNLEGADGKTFTVFELFKEPGFCLLYTSGAKVHAARNPGGLPISAYEILNSTSNQDAIKRAGFPARFICIVRPDMYIGYLKERYDESGLSHYLQTFGAGG